MLERYLAVYWGLLYKVDVNWSHGRKYDMIVLERSDYSRKFVLKELNVLIYFLKENVSIVLSLRLDHVVRNFSESILSLSQSSYLHF